MKPLLLPLQVLSQIQAFSFSPVLTTPARCNSHATPTTVKMPLIWQPCSLYLIFSPQEIKSNVTLMKGQGILGDVLVCQMLTAEKNS